MTEKDTVAEPDVTEPDAVESDAVEAHEVEPDAAETDTTESGVSDEPTEPAADTTADEPEPPAAVAGPRRRRTRIGAIAVAALLVLSAGLTSWLYFFQFRPDQQSDAAATQVALDAAVAGTTALLSYSPDTLDQNFADAKSHLTGEFLDYYTQFTQTIVTPAAREKQVQTSATVVQSAMAEMHPDSAMALLFINQTTVSKENPDGAFAASSVKVGLSKIDGKWLISTFDPV